MSDVLNFVEDHKNDDMDTLVALPEFSLILSKMQAELKRCEREEEKKIRAFLKKVEPHIEKIVSSLQNEMTSIKGEITQRQRNAQACVAYLDSARKAHPSKRRK